MTDFAPGTPVWVDLATPDAPASAAFYCELFGWEASEPAEELGGYRYFAQDGCHVAGLSPVGGPIWMTHISTVSADDTAARVAAAGGRVHYGPADVADLGRLAVCEDPGGAPFCVWESGEHQAAEKVNVPVSLTWNERIGPGRDAAAAFYAAVFGWEASEEDVAGEPYTLFGLGGRPIAGAGDGEGDAHWLSWFAVADCDATAARAAALGAAVEAGPADVPGIGRTAIVVDPQGARFGVLRGETPDE